MTKNYQDAIDSLLAKVAATDDPAVAARLAEVAINLTNAANQATALAAKELKSGEADNGSAGG